jgi:hypothetical protein
MFSTVLHKWLTGILLISLRRWKKNWKILYNENLVKAALTGGARKQILFSGE